jgi:phospholipid/cholesterol/gamma-HCH transport system substrate-binding protein
MVQEVQTGGSLLHSLIYDEYGGGGVDSVERSLVVLEEILDEVASGDGVLHTLIYEPTSEQDVVMEALEAGARLNNILEKIDSGDGTLGLLLNDPTVYDDLKLLLGGAERSLVVRSLIRLSTDEEE